MVFYLFFSLPKTIAMRSPLLTDIEFGIERISGVHCRILPAGLILSQEMPTSSKRCLDSSKESILITAL